MINLDAVERRFSPTPLSMDLTPVGELKELQREKIRANMNGTTELDDIVLPNGVVLNFQGDTLLIRDKSQVVIVPPTAVAVLKPDYLAFVEDLGEERSRIILPGGENGVEDSPWPVGKTSLNEGRAASLSASRKVDARHKQQDVA